MEMASKWLVVSPFTGEILAISDEEARRLIRSAGDLAAELQGASSRAAAGGADEPVGIPEDCGPWLVCARP